MTAKDEHLDWMVDRRNKIQSLMLRLLRARGKPASNVWQLRVGAAFSLWRAVFLCDSTMLSKPSDLDPTAADYLRKVIETNNISFGDDKNMGAWAGGYYVNNALFRLGLRTASPEGTRRLHQRLSEMWDEAFQALEKQMDADANG